MSNQIIVPALGESITEATVSKWLKHVGEKVDADEPLVELETDKVNIEVPSPLSGTLSLINVKEGDVVEVGGLLGTIGSEGSDKSNIIKIKEKKKPEPKEVKKIKETKVVDKSESEPEEEVEKENKQPTRNIQKNLLEKKEEINGDNTLLLNTLANEESSIDKEVNQNLSPAVRKIVKENEIDISKVKGSGKDGRVSKGDLLSLMGNNPKSSGRKISHGPEERVKMTRLRITIAKRLKEAQNNAAMLSTFNEVDMQNIIQMRHDYKEDFKKKYSVKLGFMSFFVKSCVVALKNFPSINAEIEGNEIIYKNYYNISIAVGTDRGLVVPVLKNADELSFADIEKNIFLMSEKAKNGKITINDLQGGTFTISNGGIYGSMLSTPILNPPQTGVLGMHNIVERAVVKEGEVVIRPIMYLALSYDHRIIDGKEAVSFLKTIKECLEEPRRLFLDL
jgi:2-oxoglutarate dehydrogenase E2 component (dihydrolipoamide succinyltransferase)